jgi:hypothetical protein
MRPVRKAGHDADNRDATRHWYLRQITAWLSAPH